MGVVAAVEEAAVEVEVVVAVESAVEVAGGYC